MSTVSFDQNNPFYYPMSKHAFNALTPLTQTMYKALSSSSLTPSEDDNLYKSPDSKSPKSARYSHPDNLMQFARFNARLAFFEVRASENEIQQCKILNKVAAIECRLDRLESKLAELEKLIDQRTKVIVSFLLPETFPSITQT
jgi:hypothetical protein